MKDFEQEILEKERQEEKAREQRGKLKELAYALDTAEGQLVLNEILKLCPIDEEVFSSDPCQTAYRCGQRSIGLAINSLVNNINRNIMIKKKEG